MAKTKKSAEPLIGGHVGGGIKGSVKKALAIGAQSMQIFLGSPQAWKEPNHSEQDLALFVSEVKKHKLGPVFVHGNYLVNVATANPENLIRSVQNLRLNLDIADRIGASGVIFHPGSAGQDPYKHALSRVIKALEKVFTGYDGKCRLLLEVCAGQGQTIGKKFSELKDIMQALGYDKRLAVCWDTCHLFNAGYDLSTEQGLRRTMDEFAEEVGFEWLLAMHANDSKTALGMKRDRHENIGYGHIGEEAFARMLNNPELRGLPWMLEVPGMEKKGPDKENIQILRRLAGMPSLN
ncbi:MAG: deoxyribonuclease IV [Candidatus Obscuribacterales bacterium]|nr:deoxyribonuclease IV [Candidatus Obscuribacterales bacterium]